MTGYLSRDRVYKTGKTQLFAGAAAKRGDIMFLFDKNKVLRLIALGESPEGNEHETATASEANPVFNLDSKTVRSAEIKSMDNDGGYGVYLILSDFGRNDIRLKSSQRPSELSICVAGRTVTTVGASNPVQLWPDEGIWTGPAMDQTGKFSIGRGHKFYGFSKEEAETLVREILQ